MDTVYFFFVFRFRSPFTLDPLIISFAFDMERPFTFFIPDAIIPMNPACAFDFILPGILSPWSVNSIECPL